MNFIYLKSVLWQGTYRTLSMKSIATKLIFLAMSTVFFQGCIAFPPLIQVEHKHDAVPPSNNDEVLKRLDAIDKRLDTLEKQPH